jgi:hypothetical protein
MKNIVSDIHKRKILSSLMILFILIALSTACSSAKPEEFMVGSTVKFHDMLWKVIDSGSDDGNLKLIYDDDGKNLGYIEGQRDDETPGCISWNKYGYPVRYDDSGKCTIYYNDTFYTSVGIANDPDINESFDPVGHDLYVHKDVSGEHEFELKNSEIPYDLNIALDSCFENLGFSKKEISAINNSDIEAGNLTQSGTKYAFYAISKETFDRIHFSFDHHLGNTEWLATYAGESQYGHTFSVVKDGAKKIPIEIHPSYGGTEIRTAYAEEDIVEKIVISAGDAYSTPDSERPINTYANVRPAINLKISKIKFDEETTVILPK